MPPCRPWAATRAARCCFSGFGTGLGSALIVDGIVEPMELGHLPYKKGTYEDYVGQRGLERTARRSGGEYVADVVARLIAALEPDDIVLGGGNARSSRSCRPAAGSATTPMRSSAGFGCGSAAADRRTQPRTSPNAPVEA